MHTTKQHPIKPVKPSRRRPSEAPYEAVCPRMDVCRVIPSVWQDPNGIDLDELPAPVEAMRQMEAPEPPLGTVT